MALPRIVGSDGPSRGYIDASSTPTSFHSTTFPTSKQIASPTSYSPRRLDAKTIFAFTRRSLSKMSTAIDPHAPRDIDTEAYPEKPDSDHVESPSKPELDAQVDKFGSNTTYSPEEKALVRKLDMFIMPMVFSMYYMNKTDQNAIANARLKGLEKDLGLHGSQFNVCVSILYVGYLVMQIPSNYLMASKKVRPSLWLAAWMAAWALCSALTAVVQDYQGLLLVRFFLGWSEAPFYPGAVYLLSIFYTRKEIATRISILYSGTIFATAFAGLSA